MKKIWKRLAMAAAAAMLSVTMGAAAMAASLTTNGTTVTSSAEVAITKVPTSAENLTYSTYQVVYASYDQKTNNLTYHLTDWAKEALVDKNNTEAAVLNDISKINTTGTSTTEQNSIVNALAAASAAEYDADWTTASGTSTADLPVGVYLVIPRASNMSFLNMLVSVDTSATTGTAANAWELNANGAVLKGKELTTGKTIVENNNNVKAADAQIGQRITYQVTADVPALAANDKTHTFKLVDTATNQKIDPDTVKVTAYTSAAAAGTVIDADDYTKNTVDNSANHTSTLTVDFTKNYFKVFTDNNRTSYPYAYVVVEYEAELLSSAVTITENGNNDNTVKYTVEYDRDGKVEKSDSTKVYTYGLELTKLDAEDQKKSLADASFTVSKDSDKLTFVKQTTTDGSAVYKVADSDSSNTETAITTGTDGTVQLIGLDAGVTYTIAESKAPSGYSINKNTMQFTITAATGTDGNVNGEIASVSGKEYSGQTEVTTNNSWKVSADKESAMVKLSLTDTKLPSLPMTGGTGIILFTAAGIILLLLAVLLISGGKKSRKNA